MTQSAAVTSAAPRCLIIVPAYNEEGSIADVVRDLRRCVPRADVLVVDDASTDRTAQCVPDDAVLLRLPFNLGIGGAMQTGYRYAVMHGYDVAVQVDGDGQHPADQVPLLLERLARGDVDLVIGSRFLKETGFRQTAARVAGSRILRALLRVLTGRTITDCTSGFRAVNAKVIAAFAHWYPEDYPEPEVVLLLHRAGFRIAETPVTMKPRQAGRTSISLGKGLFYVIKVSVALLLDMMRQPWPMHQRNISHSNVTERQDEHVRFVRDTRG